MDACPGGAGLAAGADSAANTAGAVLAAHSLTHPLEGQGLVEKGACAGFAIS